MKKTEKNDDTYIIAAALLIVLHFIPITGIPEIYLLSGDLYWKSDMIF